MDMKYYAILLGGAAVALLGIVGNNRILDAQLANVYSAYSSSSAMWGKVNFGAWPHSNTGCKACETLSKEAGAQNPPYDYCIAKAMCVAGKISIPKVTTTCGVHTKTDPKDIVVLQSFLQRKGFLKPEYVTGTFGNRTAQAVVLFQKKYNIDPTGFVGLQTRAKINSLIDEEVAAPIGK